MMTEFTNKQYFNTIFVINYESAIELIYFTLKQISDGYISKVKIKSIIVSN